MGTPAEKVHLGIGALSQATGIPEPTLRTWERRYGFPSPARTDGGHRLYDPDTVEHLRMLMRALERGMRPAQVFRARPDQILAWLGEAPPRRAPEDPQDVVERLLDAVASFDGDTLERILREDLERRGARGFGTRLGPLFLEALGRAWATGRIGIAHEHAASARLEGILRETWRPLSDGSRGPGVVLAGLPGERHELGLHLVAMLLADRGWRVLWLGADTPVEEVARAARTGVRAVLVSISSVADPAQARRDLAALSQALPAGVELGVGGSGAPRDLGVRVLDLEDLAEWTPTAP